MCRPKTAIHGHRCLGLLLLAMTGCGLQSGESLPAKHLVLVLFDTLRADRMSLYGHSLPTTPFLELVAQDFLRFEVVKATSPWTVPSHASIFTGLRPVEHRAQWGRMVLDESFDTLAEVLRSNGFCTLAFSSNRLVSQGTGLSQGFDAFTLVDRRTTAATSTIMGQLPEAIDRALARGCRLFLYVNWMDTHTPYNTFEYGSAFGARGPGPAGSNVARWEVSAGVRSFSNLEWRLHRAAYDAAVRHLDARTADLMEILRDREILDDSLLVLTSDHGEGLGDHTELGHALSVWEEQLAVPLLIRLPGRQRGGEVVAERTSLAALMPSLLDWLGVRRPDVLGDAPNLEDASKSPIGADYRSFFSEEARSANRRMARRYPQLAARVTHAHVLYCGPHKLTQRANGEASFYNLLEDPREQENLASQSPEALIDCLKRYQEALDSGFFTPFDDRVSREEAERSRLGVDSETLRALGYLQ